MSGIRVLCTIALASSLTLSGLACMKNKKGKAPKASDQSMASDAAGRSGRLHATIQDLDGVVAQLPSGDDANDQRNIGAGLGDIATALQLMSPERTSGGFDQQIDTMKRVSGILTNGVSDRDPEPLINNGFWAALSGMRQVSNQFDDTDVDQQIVDLDSQVRMLDRSRGPLHRLAASGVLRSASQVLARMTTLADQEMQKPAAEPTTTVSN